MRQSLTCLWIHLFIIYCYSVMWLAVKTLCCILTFGCKLLNTILYVSSSLLVNSSVEHCRTDDLMPNIPISCLLPSHVDPKVQGLKVIISCPQPGSFQAPNGRPTNGRSSKCDGNDTVMVLLGGRMSIAGVWANSAGMTWPSPTVVNSETSVCWLA